jgi:DNA processing protein
VLTEDDAEFPVPLTDDLEPPAVLFARGDLQALEGPRIAIVGTRRCTLYGREVAHDLGRDLAGAGVRVVSGLALGIDGAAHSGALEAAGGPPVGVVGNGLDVAYPRRHAQLYERIGSAGLLLSEHPLGTKPRSWAFPARNRIVAALAHAVVVVECHARGGSLYTVEEAVRRDVEVFAVPGSVRSPASVGTNQLLHEGHGPVRDAADVLVHLGLSVAQRRAVDPDEGFDAGAGVASGGSEAGSPGRRPPPAGLGPVLDALGWEEASLEQLLLRSGLGLAELHAALAELEQGGWISWNGSWVERRAGSGAT